MERAGQTSLANGQDRLSEDTHALVRPAGTEDDGVMGVHDRDQGDVAEPALPPLTAPAPPG